MCFSPTASFAASAALVPLGGYTFRESLKRNRKYIAVALLPMIFGFQQFTEGFVWLGLQSQNATQVKIFSYLFLFFAFGLWPFYVPFMIWNIEKDKTWRKRVLLAFTFAGAVVGILVYVPLIIGTTSFTTRICNDCIAYETSRGDLHRNIYTLMYLLVTVIPFFLAKNKKMLIFGGLIIGSIVITLYFYSFAFFSVWCFFAAILSVYILYVIRTEEQRSAAGKPKES